MKKLGLLTIFISTAALAESVIIDRGGSSNSDRGIYSPVGKRDPFKAPGLDSVGRDVSSVNPLQKFGLEQLQLRAILKDSRVSRAMLEDPEGRTHIISEGDVIGRERCAVSRILKTEVIVTEKTFNYLGVETLYEKVLSLPQGSEVGQLDFVPAPTLPSSADAATPKSGSGTPGQVVFNGLDALPADPSNFRPPAFPTVGNTDAAPSGAAPSGRDLATQPALNPQPGNAPAPQPTAAPAPEAGVSQPQVPAIAPVVQPPTPNPFPSGSGK